MHIAHESALLTNQVCQTLGHVRLDVVPVAVLNLRQTWNCGARRLHLLEQLDKGVDKVADIAQLVGRETWKLTNRAYCKPVVCL